MKYDIELLVDGKPTVKTLDFPGAKSVLLAALSSVATTAKKKVIEYKNIAMPVLDAPNVEKIQARLKLLGFYGGKVDGIKGPNTSAAIIAFKKSVGLKARDYFGPLTKAALFLDRKIEQSASKEASWLRRARMEIGQREVKGYRHNMRIVKYWISAKLSFRDDETPWCAGFVNAMLEECGVAGTKSGMARSFSWGWGQKLKSAKTGSIVVFWRGSKSGSSGHVGFVVGTSSNGNLLVLGGNQSDQVKISEYSRDRVIGYYWPNSIPAATALDEVSGTFSKAGSEV